MTPAHTATTFTSRLSATPRPPVQREVTQQAPSPSDDGDQTEGENHHAHPKQGRHQPRPRQAPGRFTDSDPARRTGRLGSVRRPCGAAHQQHGLGTGQLRRQLPRRLPRQDRRDRLRGVRTDRRCRRAHHQLLLPARLAGPLMYAGVPPASPTKNDCEWWNLVCQGGHQVVDAGLGAITRATANGANQLLGEIVRVVDESTQVPLADPTYQRIYAGFLGLAAPLMGVILCLAVIVAAIRRDPGTLGRAVTGVLVAGLGGGLYIVLAQLLVGLDDWLSHGIVLSLIHI